MEVMIIATKGCSHCAGLIKELNSLNVDHEVKYAEEEPELVARYSIRHSPNLVVDGKVLFRRMPTEGELRQCLGI